jgi:hypothetical protein
LSALEKRGKGRSWQQQEQDNNNNPSNESNKMKTPTVFTFLLFSITTPSTPRRAVSGNRPPSLSLARDGSVAYSRSCILEGGHMDAYKVGSEGENLELVVGKLVNNPGRVEAFRDKPETFEDERRQIVFRKDTAWNLLLVDKKKIGVALFDAYLGPNIESDTPNAESL